MALIKCEECGHMVSDKARKCPKCGAPVGKKPATPIGGSATPKITIEQKEYMPSQYRGKSENKKNLAIILLCVVLVVVVVGGVVLLFWGNKPSMEATFEVSQLVNDTVYVDSNSSTKYNQTTKSGETARKIVGYKNYRGDIEGIICFFNLYFEGEVNGEQQVHGKYYYQKSGSDNTLDLRGTYKEATGAIFLREYLEDGTPHAYMELTKDEYGDKFSGVFTRHNGAKMDMTMIEQ